MSTATENPPTISPAGAEWVPSPLYRMSVEQYEAMVASGVFQTRDRIHLINGYLVAKMTQYPPHIFANDMVAIELTRILPARGFFIRPAEPIRLPAQASAPEPDRCVVRGTPLDYGRRYPGPADIVLLIEVADSSLGQDRKLASAVYGPAGIAVYWIIDVVHRQVEIYTDPVPDGYRSKTVFAEGESVPVVIDGQEFGRIAVADLFLPDLPPTEGNGA